MTWESVTRWERGRDWKYHAKGFASVEMEFIITTSNVDEVCCFEDRLESDSFFSYIPPLSAADDFLSTGPYTCQRVDLFERKSDLITIDT